MERAFHEKAHRKRKAKGASDSSANLDIDSSAAGLQPVIVRSTQDRTVRSFSPIYIDNCLKQSIGDYVSWISLSNGDFMIKGRTAQQIGKFLSMTSWSDGKKSVSISTTLLPPQGSKGVLYNVPLDLTWGTPRKFKNTECHLHEAFQIPFTGHSNFAGLQYSTSPFFQNRITCWG